MHKDELLRAAEFNVSDFFARVLLYTTYVNNIDGRQCVVGITDDYIKEAAKNNWSEVELDADRQKVIIKPSKENYFWDRIHEINWMYIVPARDLLGIPWLVPDELYTLFPSHYVKVEFKDPEKRHEAVCKMKEYMELTHELASCLKRGRESRTDYAPRWPIFPDEQMKEIFQRMEDIGGELFVLGMLRSNNEDSEES